MALLRKLAGGQKSKDNTIKSIIDNLNNVLGTKRDYGFFLQNFGISDYNHISSRDDIAKAIIKEITENVELFEPRIVLNKIVDIEDDRLLRLSFRVDFELDNKPHSFKLFLAPKLDSYQVKL